MPGVPKVASKAGSRFSLATARVEDLPLVRYLHSVQRRATGADLSAARARAYRAVDTIHFDGAQLRRDIGARG